MQPETRSSLLLRVGDAQDQAAWEEFIELYHPVIYRTARLRGLQDADAHDVAQCVLIKVGRSLNERPHDRGRARFRTWLATVTRNEAINALRRWQADRGTGDSDVQKQLHNIADNDQQQAVWEAEYQKELFRLAARRIEPEFEAVTWQSFWRTTVEGESIAAVSESLGKQVGSIYAARSRIMRRLREEVDKLQSET
ncbi:MAG: sigma-70 family RNA polymerase sigma factor [Pirellulaceae bacterium]